MLHWKKNSLQKYFDESIPGAPIYKIYGSINSLDLDEISVFYRTFLIYKIVYFLKIACNLFVAFFLKFYIFYLPLPLFMYELCFRVRNLTDSPRWYEVKWKLSVRRLSTGIHNHHREIEFSFVDNRGNGVQNFGV